MKIVFIGAVKFSASLLLALIEQYESEMGEFPFPRSEIAIRSLAQLRGSEAGFIEAEGFMLLKERVV